MKTVVYMDFPHVRPESVVSILLCISAVHHYLRASSSDLFYWQYISDMTSRNISADPLLQQQIKKITYFQAEIVPDHINKHFISLIN
jgi:hypothetical protein